MDVARYFIRRGEVSSQNDISHLKLQKLLYLAQLESVKSMGEVLFDEDIEAWDYGPIVKSVHDEFKGSGTEPIYLGKPQVNLPQSTEELLRQVWDKWAVLSAFRLIDIVHSHKAWLDSFKRGRLEGGIGVISRQELEEQAVSI
jgi:uncharacterized phage-associated protein